MPVNPGKTISKLLPSRGIELRTSRRQKPQKSSGQLAYAKAALHLCVFNDVRLVEEYFVTVVLTGVLDRWPGVLLAARG